MKKFFTNSTKTNRGFKYREFLDSYNSICSIQESSAASGDKIWLGINCEPKILVKDVGWLPYKLPENVHIATRMHLDRKQCIKLAFELLKFGITNKI